jgi:hypothetical protein
MRKLFGASGSRREARRALLKTGLGALFLAPFLRQRELAAQVAQPKRLVLVFTPDSHPREWWPSPGGPNGLTLQAPLQDFAGLERELLFVRQLDHSWTVDNHHQAGVAQLFTGQRFSDDVTRYAAGPSIDQVLLAHTDLRGGTPVSDVHIAVADAGGGDQRHVVCYSGAGQPIPHEPDPGAVFRNLFAGVQFGASPAPAASAGSDLDARLEQATLALDGDELRKIQGFLGQDERERLEQHLSALTELEAELGRRSAGSAVMAPAGCHEVDTRGLTLSDRDADVIDTCAKVSCDLIVNAFACDRTRVVDLAFGSSGTHHAGLLGLTLPPSNSWHDVAHTLTSEGARAGTVTVGGSATPLASAYGSFDGFWARQIAYLARQLAATPEGDGSMLDNTLIYWGVECGTDHNHGPTDIPYLLIGGRNLGIQSGQLLTFASARSAHQLHTSVLHAFGYTDATGFGIEPTCGPLTGVLA